MLNVRRRSHGRDDTPGVSHPWPSSRASALGRLRPAAAALGIAAAVALTAAACGSDSKKTAATPTSAATAAPTQVSAEAQALRQVFITAIERWNAKDFDGFVAHFTDKGLVSSFGEPGQTAAETRDGMKGFFASQPIKPRQFSQESVTGNTGAMDVVFQLGPLLLHSKFTLARSGTAWMFDGEESDLPMDLPAGATAINVDLRDFAFGVDDSAIAKASGTFAFVANNVGTQSHEITLAKIPAAATPATLVQQIADARGADVPGVEFIGGTAADPGQKRNLVFAESLPAGHYLMICFAPDTSQGPGGPPHALKGMFRDFTIK